MFALRRAAVAPAAKLVRLAKTTGEKTHHTSILLFTLQRDACLSVQQQPCA
jgi:hypothetical protein